MCFLIKMAKFIKLIVLVFITSLVVPSLADGQNHIQRRNQKQEIARKRVQADAPLPNKKKCMFKSLIHWPKHKKKKWNTNFYFCSAFKDEIASKTSMNFVRKMNEFDTVNIQISHECVDKSARKSSHLPFVWVFWIWNEQNWVIWWVLFSRQKRPSSHIAQR